MGDIHDLSGYTRQSMVVEFTELARQGLQTPQPFWMQKERLPEWAAKTKEDWISRGHDLRDKMALALIEQAPPPKVKK